MEWIFNDAIGDEHDVLVDNVAEASTFAVMGWLYFVEFSSN